MLKEKIENIDKSIDTVLHSDLIVHLIMIGAATASLFNVFAFFGDNHWIGVAAVLAVILGLVLVVMSSKLSRLPIDWHDNDYKITAFTTIGIGLISGAVQTAVYHEHMDSVWAAAALGFGLPMGFEVCLAFAVASYKRTMRTVAASDSRDRLADSMQSKFNDAIDHIDGNGMTEMFQGMADTVARELAQSLQAQMVADIRNATPDFKVVDAARDAAKMLEEIPHISDISDVEDGISALNEARKEQMQERVSECLKVIQGGGSMGISAIADALNVSADTARRYCKELEASGMVYNQDRKWHPALSIEMPEFMPSELRTNGAHA